MLTFKFTYSDGHTRVESFNTLKEAQWFAYNEGDHLKYYEEEPSSEFSEVETPVS